MDYEYILTSDGELYHHGIKGQKWGRRRYQNPDGTWTNAGKERYGDDIPDGKSESSSGEGKKTSRGLAIAKTAARAAAGVLKNPTSKHENNGGINSLSDKLRPRSTKDKNDGGVNSLDERLRPTVMSAKGDKNANSKPLEYDWDDDYSKRRGKVDYNGSDTNKRMRGPTSGSSDIDRKMDAKYSTFKWKKKYGMTRREVNKKISDSMMDMQNSEWIKEANKKHISRKKLDNGDYDKQKMMETLNKMDEIRLREIGYKGDLETGRRMLIRYDLDTKLDDLVW